MVDRLAQGTPLSVLPVPIFLMAYLQEPQTNHLYTLVKMVPRTIRNCMCLPLALGFPAHELRDEGNLLMAGFRMVSIGQIYDAAGIMPRPGWN